MSAPPAVTSGHLTTPVAIVTVPSVRLLPKNAGLKIRSMTCWMWRTFTWCSPFRPNCIHCFSSATEPCTICCSEQSPKHCPSLLQIGSTWEPKIGFTSVLHTWGQNLSFHPHIHCIVPAGGLTRVMQWRNSRKKFFLPVRVLSRKFRGKFLALLRQTPELAGKLNQAVIDACYHKEWVVYCKPPFKDAACVVEYLGRYTHRVAISNSRILSISDGKVSFKWRDYKDGSRWKIMSLSAAEFIRRFLLHVLPKGFMKIRHYGILGNRDKDKRLKFCKLLTGTRIIEKLVLSAEDLLLKICGHDPCLCPACGQGRIEFYMNLPPPVGF